VDIYSGWIYTVQQVELSLFIRQKTHQTALGEYLKLAVH